MSHSTNKKPIRVGISIGDINGIGPEIIIKMLSDDRIYALCQPIIYGSTKVLSYYKKMLKNEISNADLIIKLASCK